MSRQCDVTPDGGADGFASEPATDSAFFIGKIETVIGSCTLSRSDDSAVQIKPGDPVCEGDTIQTAADGKVCIRFIDGTVFNLSDSARMVLREFAGDVASPSAQFDVSNGTFAFIAGEMAKTGRLNIDTPFASIQGRSRAGGIGTLSLASLFFAAMEEVHAKTPALSFLDDGVINFKESEDYKDAIRDGKFGTVELTVKAAQPYTTYLNDPGDTIVLRQIGSSVSESHIPNSLVQMLGFANDQQQVLQVAAQGQGPTGFGNGGSSTPPPLPPEFAPQPINTFVPQPPPFLPPTGGSSGSTTTALDFVPTPEPPEPPPPVPPTITATPAAVNVTSNQATITFAFSVAPTDFVLADTSVTGGTLSDFAMVDPTHYTAIFTATPGIQTNNASVGVIADSYHDINGNVGLGGSTIFTVDTLTPTGSTPDLIDASDFGISHIDNVTNVTNPNFTIALDPTVQVGDTVQLLLDGSPLAHNVTHTITAADVSAGNVSLTVTDGDLGADGTKLISAQFSDAAGNGSTTSALAFILDTTADAGTALALNAFNASGGVRQNLVAITLSGIDSDIASGTVTLSDGDGHTATHTLTTAEIAAGSATLHAADFANFATLDHIDNTITVSASVTDDAGNSTGPSNTSFILDTTADAGTALALNAFNASGGVRQNLVAITLSGIDSDIASGTVTLSDGDGHTATHTLTTAEIAAGSATLHAADFANFATLDHIDNTITVSASVTDDAGNSTGPSNTSFILDTTADAGTALALNAFNASGGVRQNLVAITLSGIDSDIASGTVTLSDGDGHTATHTLTTAEIAAGSATLHAADFANFATLDHIDNTITVSASVTDGAGNSTGPSNTSFILDTTADAGTALALNAFNASGGVRQNLVAITLSGIDSDIASGTVTLSDGDGHTATHTLTTAEIAAGSATLHAADFANFATLDHIDNTITVSASVTDDAGNSAGPSNTSFILDTTADAGTALALNAFNASGGVRQNLVAITLSGIDSDIASGTVTLSDGDGHTATHTLTTAEIAAGSATLHAADFANFATLDHIDNTITVSASVTDGAGNSTGPSNTSFILDTTADAGTALALNAFNASGGVRQNLVAITLSGIDSDIASGTVTLSDGDGHTATHTLTTAEIAAGSATLHAADFANFATLDHIDNTITVSASVTDDAGNSTGPSNTSFILDTTADAGTALALNAFNASGGVRQNLVAITLSGIDSDIASGTVTLSDGDGHTATHTLTTAEIAAGSATLHAADFANFATLDHIDNTITVSASVTDDAGNSTGPSNTSFILDTTADAGTALALNAFNASGGVRQNLVAITLSGIDSDIASGTVTLSDGDGHTATHTLTTAEIAAGSATLHAADFANFATLDHIDNTITVSASVTDDAGNSTGPSNTSFILDTTADAGTALALNAFNASGGVRQNLVAITLSGIDSDIASGTVTLSDGDGHTATHTLTTAEIAAGSATLHAADFANFATLDHIDNTITVSASVTDDAGNSTGPSNTSFILDTTAPSVTATSAPVYEAALDTSTTDHDLGAGTVTGSDPSSPTETATGTLTFSDANGPVKVTGVAPGNVGSAVGNVGTIISGSYGLLQINQDGGYTYTLTKPFTTSPAANDGANSESGKDVFTYTVTDAAGNASTSTISIDIVDDVPDAAANIRNVPEGTLQSADVQFIVDLSGSMYASSGGSVGFDVPGYSDDRIGLARYSMQQLLLSNDQIENVQIIRFGDSASGTLWLSKAQALAFIQNDANWASLGGTNYDAALQQAITSFGSGPASPSEQSIVYFMSDGAPTTGGGITSDGSGNNVSIAEWENHVTGKGIDQVFAIGIGNGVNVDNLEPIAYPNTDVRAPFGVEDNVIIVSTSDVAALPDRLQDALELHSSIVGNILSNDPGTSTGADSFGADGARILSIKIGAITYTYDPAGNDISASPGPQPPQNTPVLTVTTALGGTFTFYFAASGTHVAGDWSYLTGTAGAESFSYVLIDGDGDHDPATLSINVLPLPANQAPAGADHTVNLVEDVSHTFAISDFGFSDVDGNDFAGVVINTLPNAGDGVLRLGNTAIAAGTFITANQISDGSLIYTPVDNVIGDTGDGSFTFSVRDDGGTANGGVNTDTSPNTMTLDMSTTNFTDNLPSSGNNTITTTALTGANESYQEQGGSGDSLRIDTASGGSTVFTDLHFYHSDNNLEVGWTTGAGSRVVTAINEFGGNTFEVFRFDDGGTYAGYSLGNSDYSLDQGLSGSSSNDIESGTAGNDSISGGSGNDLLFGNGGDDTLTGGTGADLLVGGLGHDTFVISSGQSLGTTGGTLNNGTLTGYDVIADFDLLADKLNLNGTPTVAADTNGLANPNGNGNNSTLTIGGAQVSQHSITNGIITFYDNNGSPLPLTSLQNVAAVVQYLHDSDNDLGSSNVTVAFNATIDGVPHTFIDQQVGNSPNASNDILIDLYGVTINNLSQLIINGVVDPIVLDLGAPGLSFTSAANGVSFDINGDGIKDQVAWTAGADGILAYDVNGSGTIENGTELFTPNFAGGNYASGLAALTTLDTNSDGLINSADANFSKLVVWQDSNHNGVADAGEMSSLTDNGISAINLDATPTDGSIDGQGLQAQGTFSYANGTTGTFVEVALATVPGTAPDTSTSPNGTGDPAQNSSPANGNAPVSGSTGNTLIATPGSTLTGIGDNDTFVFKAASDSLPGAGHFDTITNFAHGLDHIDLTSIAGATNVQGEVTEANTVAANSISWFVDNAHNETRLYVNTSATANHVDMEIHLTGTNINLAGSDILHHA